MSEQDVTEQLERRNAHRADAIGLLSEGTPGAGDYLEFLDDTGGLMKVEGDNVGAGGPGGGAESPASPIIEVGDGLDFDTISEAMASISDAAADKIYTLRLHPSFKRAPNTWDVIQWKPFVIAEFVGGAGMAFDYDGVAPERQFIGIDISLCSAENFNPFTGDFVRAFFGSEPDLYAETIEDLVTLSDAVQGSLAFMQGDLGGAKMYALSGPDYTVAEDWIDVTSNLSQGRFDGKNFAGAAFIACNCEGIYLTGTQLMYSEVDGSNFNNCQIIGANITRMSGYGASFQFGSLALSDARAVSFHTCDFTSANLTNNNARNSFFQFGIFIGANLSTSDFSGGIFVNANFTNANLSNANFSRCNFTGANLAGVNAVGTNFTGATMPAGADTKAEFIALVGSYDPNTTIWTDGKPIGNDIESITVTLTDAQIKALPGTIVEVVPAPGAGKVLILVDAFLRVDCSGGIYSNRTGGADIFSDSIHFVYGNDDADASQYVVASGFLGYAGVSIAALGRPLQVDESAGWHGRIPPSVAFAASVYENKAINLIAYNDAGDFTGGHVDNTIEATVNYRIVDA